MWTYLWVMWAYLEGHVDSLPSASQTLRRLWLLRPLPPFTFAGLRRAEPRSASRLRETLDCVVRTIFTGSLIMRTRFSTSSSCAASTRSHLFKMMRSAKATYAGAEGPEQGLFPCGAGRWLHAIKTGRNGKIVQIIQ